MRPDEMIPGFNDYVFSQLMKYVQKKDFPRLPLNYNLLLMLYINENGQMQIPGLSIHVNSLVREMKRPMDDEIDKIET